MEASENNESAIYATNYLKRRIIGPAQRIVDKANVVDIEKTRIRFAYHAYYHLRRNENHLNLLQNNMSNGIYCNDKAELEDMANQYRTMIVSLKKIVDAYKEDIRAKVSLINIPAIKAHLGNFEKYNILLDKIQLMYENPLNDMLYGQEIRLFIIELAEINKAVPMNLVTKYIQELKDYLEHVKEDMLINDQTSSKSEEELKIVKSDFLNLIELYESLLDKESTE